MISGAVSDGTTEFSPDMKLNVYSILRLINDESEVEVAVYNDEFDLIFSKVLPIE